MQDQVHADQFSRDGRTRPAGPNAFCSMWVEMMPGAFYRTRAGGLTSGGRLLYPALVPVHIHHPKGGNISTPPYVNQYVGGVSLPATAWPRQTLPALRRAMVVV